MSCPSQRGSRGALALVLVLLVGCASTPAPPPRDLRGNALVHHCRTLSQDLTDDAQAELVIQLQQASPGDFERVLSALDLKALFHELAEEGWDEESPEALLELLSATRVIDASPKTRAKLVHALMDAATEQREEQALVSIFRETPAAELTALKLAVDAGYPDDLLALVYDDVDDDALRGELIGRCQAASTSGRIVLIDVDDTLFPMLNDERYPDGRIYPGVRSLLRALSAGQPTVVGLLTGRPGPLGAYTVRSVAERGVPVRVALTGTLTGFRSHGVMAANKREVFLRYRALYPNVPALFCGDTGQGDGEVALALLEEGALDVALLHDVRGLEPAERQAFEEKGVVVFETYLGAALALERAGWIEREQLLRVARYTLAELKSLSFPEGADLSEHFARDVAAIEAHLDLKLASEPR